MPVFNYAKKEVNLKIVYYGPGLSGKTTNLQAIHDGIKPESKGKLVSLATQTDRTLFFDFMPMELGSFGGFRIRLHLYTVPGQVHYNATRKLVLKGVDGVVFVADSQRAMAEANLESFSNLEKNLRSYGKDLEEMPHLIQANKRDLEDILSMEEIASMVNRNDAPMTEAVASEGTGVIETLSEIIRMVMRGLKDQLSMPRKEEAAEEDRTRSERARREPVSPPEEEPGPLEETLPEELAEPEEDAEPGEEPGPGLEPLATGEPEPYREAGIGDRTEPQPDLEHEPAPYPDELGQPEEPGEAEGHEGEEPVPVVMPEPSVRAPSVTVPPAGARFPGEPIRITLDVEGVGPVELTLDIQARLLGEKGENGGAVTTREFFSGGDGAAGSGDAEPERTAEPSGPDGGDERIAPEDGPDLPDPASEYLPPEGPVNIFPEEPPEPEGSEPQKKGLIGKFFGKK